MLCCWRVLPACPPTTTVPIFSILAAAGFFRWLSSGLDCPSRLQSGFPSSALFPPDLFTQLSRVIFSELSVLLLPFFPPPRTYFRKWLPGSSSSCSVSVPCSPPTPNRGSDPACSGQLAGSWHCVSVCSAFVHLPVELSPDCRAGAALLWGHASKRSPLPQAEHCLSH